MDDWERSVVVGGVPGDVSEDHLQMYFENAHRSSGGRVESLRIDRTASAAVVTFTDPEAAERVKNRTHQLIGNSMYVMALNDSQGEQQLVLKVSGLPRGLDDSLIGYFENCPDGSSPIEAMHRVRGDCFVTFKNQRDARAAARKRLTIKGHELTVELLKNSESDVSLCDSTCSDITILSECNSDLGFAICQQRQTTTGSGMAKMQQPEHIDEVDDDVTDEACESRAYSGISSPDVEESILIMDEDFEYCYPGCLSDASERKVLVHAMNGVCDEELIHLLFSNKEKYNGGPIQEMTIAADLKTALITFCDKQDADNILNREQVEFMGKVYKTSKPVLTTIKLSDVPACMTSDMLTVLLEENKGSSFSSCPDITIDRENREAIVTFGDASEADKIAECSKIVYASMKVEKVILPPVRDTQMSSPNEIDSCQQKENGVSPEKQVLVSGIEDNADEDFLRLLFTSKKKSGGGPIKDFSLRENGTALITYEEQRDAVDVLAHQNVVFMDRTYAVSRLGVQRDLEDEKVTLRLTDIPPGTVEGDIEFILRKSSGLDDCQFKIELDSLSGSAVVTLPDNTVANHFMKYKVLKLKGFTINLELFHDSRLVSVRNLPKDDDVNTVKLLFENVRRTGGGPIENVEYVEEGFHLITFTSPKDALNVYEYSLRGQGIEWKGLPLTIHLLEPVQGHPQSHAIIVDNIDPESMSKEFLTLYFENAKYSNGGPVKSVVLREDGKSAVVCFLVQKVAELVAKKRSHELNGVRLHVTPLHPRLPPPLIRPPVEACVLFLWGAPHSADANTIKMFVEEATGCRVLEVVFAAVPGKAMLVFDQDPDYTAIRKHCTCYPMLDQMVQVQKVPQSRSIQVLGFSSTLQLLELYFENTKRSDGGLVESTDGHQEHAIVTFKDKSTMDRILAREHVLNGQKLIIKKYFACLGVLTGPYQPAVTPSDIQIKIEDPAVMAFIVKASNLRLSIEANLREAGCRVSWPERVNAPLILQCTLNKKTDGYYRASKAWGGNVNRIIHSLLSKYSSERITIVSGIWDKFKARVNKMIQKQDPEKLTITLSKSESLCVLAGLKSLVTKVLDQVKELVNAVTIEYELSKVILLDKIQLDECWQKRVLNYHELANVSRLYPRVEIESARPESSIIFLRGCSDDIQRAKTYVENFLYDVPRRVLPVSVTTKTLLSGCESKDPILSRMNGRFVHWEASGEGHAVCIYALDEGDIDRWIAEIGHVIKEHKKNIDNIRENNLRRVIANLEHRFPGRLSVLRNSNSELEFSVFWDVETDVLRMFNQLTRKDVGFNKKKLFYPK